MHLVAVVFNWQLLVVILEVAFGLGMVIFVHELGHFAVAKWCGVKVEKFYLGFDIYGLKLIRFRRGETEYGVGILPLGGYVKMLGQDDNPAHAAGERERSILRNPDGTETPQTSSDTLDVDGERYQLDPRSYMAKSVPQRMAIISAGVIMNVLFACLMAAVAYSLGVRDLACGISAVYPGEAAWRADMQPGDQILEINHSGDRPLRFRDLMNAVALADMSEGIDFKIKREGVPEPFSIIVKPDLDPARLRPTIGVVQPRTTVVASEKSVVEATPAAKAGAFRPGDKIVAINGEKIVEFADYEAQLARKPAEPLEFTVERSSKPESGSAQPATKEQVKIELPPRPGRTLGLVMKMGKITAVQVNSPAAEEDLRPGDFITGIDGEPPGDPLRLAESLRKRAGETITLSISREVKRGEDKLLEKKVTLREPRWTEESEAPGSPVGVPALGISFKVLNIVHETRKGSPAADARLLDDDKPASVPRLAVNDEIVLAEFTMPARSKEQEKKAAEDHVSVITKLDPIKFSAEEPNWAFFMNTVQWLPPGTKIKLTLKDGRTTTVESVDAAETFYADRGLMLESEYTIAKADSLGQALAMGARETVETVVGVYSFLRKIGSQISPYMLGGPKTIAEAAGGAAYRGFSDLLIFLTMLSANLAVINFLPIPLLDGGHMVFLTLEGIMRRPVSERVVVAFHYLGFLFIISLMVFVLGLDFGLIPRTN